MRYVARLCLRWRLDFARFERTRAASQQQEKCKFERLRVALCPRPPRAQQRDERRDGARVGDGGRAHGAGEREGREQRGRVVLGAVRVQRGSQPPEALRGIAGRDRMFIDDLFENMLTDAATSFNAGDRAERVLALVRAYNACMAIHAELILLNSQLERQAALRTAGRWRLPALLRGCFQSSSVRA
jgi:hypothetical protein